MAGGASPDLPVKLGRLAAEEVLEAAKKELHALL